MGACVRVWVVLACALLCTVGCGETRRYDQALGILVDVSGTYADQKEFAVDLIKREILPGMQPGDTLLLIRIDGESYDRENVEGLMTLDRRPSQANAQKLDFARALDVFAARRENARHTDIPGAMMLASEYLREVGAGSSAIVVFSDLQTDLPRGATRVWREDELTDTRIVAMNVKRLSRDTYDPEVYRDRLGAWESRALQAGAAEWRTLLDPQKLPAYLEGIRG